MKTSRDSTPDTQYRIGSITKTFTATAVMQLRDAGQLDLDDRLEQHIDGIANGTPTIRRLLCHLSGLQREAGEMFVTGESPTEDALIASMSEVEFVLGPAQAHHYSNLAFALLGQVVARKSGLAYTQYVYEHIIRPLGLSRTTWTPQAPKAQGYLVDEYARTVWTEPETDLAGTAAAGQLWSTVEDLGRWATFLARGAEGVLAAKTNEEMWFPQVMYYPHDWVLGWGLGLMLYNQGGSIYGGHGGAMAGHLAGVYIEPKDADRRRGAHELGHARRHGHLRDQSRGEGDGALAGADRNVAARSRSRRLRSERFSGAGSPRGTSSSSGGSAGPSRRRSSARRRAEARRHSSAMVTRGGGRRARARRALAHRRRPADLVGLRLHARAGALQGVARLPTPARRRRPSGRRRRRGRCPPSVSSVRPRSTSAAKRRGGHRR